MPIHAASTFCIYIIDNGLFYKVILAEFVSFYWLILVFSLLHKADSDILSADCLRTWYVYNE